MPKRRASNLLTPGYYYMFIKIDGTDHILNIENESIAKALEPYKGQGEITIQAEGREEQAVIKILKPDGTSEVAQPPAQTASSAPASSGNGLADFQAHLQKMASAFTEIKLTVRKEMDASKGGFGDTEEMFQSEVMAMFINADRAGLISRLPEA
jgi:hypothetical protein